MNERCERSGLPEETLRIIDDERMSSWKYLLPAGPSSSVLLLAETLGSAPMSLARSFGRVTVAGLEKNLASELETLSRGRGIDNIVVVCDDPSGASGRFDVIIISAGMIKDPGGLASLVSICDGRLAPGGHVFFLGSRRSSGMSAGRASSAWKALGWQVDCVYSFLPSEDDYKLIVPTRPFSVFRSGLKMHNTLTVASSIKKTGVQLLGALGLLESVMPAYGVAVSKGASDGFAEGGWLSEYLSAKLGHGRFRMIIHNASPGEGAKAILKLVTNSGSALAYVKIADNRVRGIFIENEYRTLVRLEGVSLKTASVPTLAGFDIVNGHYILILKASDEGFAANIRSMDATVTDFLIELFERTSSVKKLEETLFWAQTQKALYEFSSGPYGPAYGWLSDIAFGLMERLKGESFPFGMVHRDFVGWNIKRMSDSRLYVMDWEWARPEHIPFQDFFHFILLTEWANSGKSVETILRESFFSGKTKYSSLLRRYASALDIPIEKSYDFLLLYLAEWTAFHITQITEARQWATQALDFLGKAGSGKIYTEDRWLKGI
ncbi:MAG: hypothetical protein AABY51_04200 [Deltaproteobacteria bacterium]